ncbi:MAG: gliding motility lipoprotein GldD [Bacteroidota bacterium]
MIKVCLQKKKIISLLAVGFLFMMLMTGCGSDPSPKPRGYFRIDMPEQEYRDFDTTKYRFEYPVHAELQTEGPDIQEPYWFNIHYPDFSGTVYFSYKRVDDNLATLIDDSYEFVSKHMTMASAVDERVVLDRSKDKYGLIFEIEGAETASPYQFFLTDSTANFLRGALYFHNKPNNDSLAPVIDYVKEDMEHFIKTFRWKN